MKDAVKNGITNDFVLYWHQLSEMTAHRGRHFSPDLLQRLQVYESHFSQVKGSGRIGLLLYLLHIKFVK